MQFVAYFGLSMGRQGGASHPTIRPYSNSNAFVWRMMSLPFYWNADDICQDAKHISIYQQPYKWVLQHFVHIKLRAVEPETFKSETNRRNMAS